jgi:tetratricopeptide (TPR) repeat protein
MPGDILGTLRYMSPEQAAGGIVCDHRIDIYALGVTLYELVTLRPAVDARDRATAMRQVTEQTPTRPRKHDRRIPLDLERILLHAMAKRAEDRYQSAREMAADLQNFLEQKPVLARRASHLSQMRGWLRRNRLIATCLTSVLCLLITLAVSGPFVAMSYSRMAQNERAARQMADANAKELRQVLAKALVRESAVEGQRLSASELRRKLSEDAVVYYERLLQRNPRDETTRFEAANAKSNLASWQYQAQDPSSALTTRKQAVGLLRELSIEFPTSDEYRFELAHNYRVLASDLKYPPVQDFEAAAEYARQAVVIGEALAVKSPSNLDYLQEMNGSYVESARVFMDSRQYDKAESMLLKAVASARQSVDRFPDDPDARCMEGWSRSNLGQLYVVQTRYAEAEEILKAGEAAYAEHYRSVKYYPEGYRLAYVDCSVTRGACLYRMRRANEAAMCLSAARERLIEIDRSSALLNWVLGAQQRLNITWVDVLIAQHNLGEAEVCLRQMIGSDAHKSDHEVTVDGTHMTAMFELARLLWFTDKYDESRRLCHEISQHLEHSPTQFRSFRPRFLTQCPFPEWHDPQLAVALINERPSTENQPWELLSVAQYQCGDLPGAQQSLVRTMDAHHGGDAFDFLRMAIIERRLNQESSSLRWYDKAEAARNEVWYSQYFKYPDEWESLQTEYREAVACR